MEIDIYENLETNQLELSILAPEDAVGFFNTTSGYSSFSSSDNSARYKFSLCDDRLTMTKIYTSDSQNSSGHIRPWYLEKINTD